MRTATFLDERSSQAASAQVPSATMRTCRAARRCLRGRCLGGRGAIVRLPVVGAAVLRSRRMHRPGRGSNATACGRVNSGAADLLSNFACRCAERGIDWRGGTLVYALDSAIHRRLKASGVASYHLPSLELSRPNEQFGDPTYSGMVMWKSAIVWDVLMMGRDVLYQVH